MSFISTSSSHTIGILKSFLKITYNSILCLSGLWAIGFLIFAQAALSPEPFNPNKTQLIVVLTGGNERIQEGLRLLDDGLGERLFISGVNKAVSLESLLSATYSKYAHLKSKVVLGKEALNTQGNAKETRQWIQAHTIHSIRLITANYHMPRSLLQFKRELPGITIIPHVVMPKAVRADDWWSWPGTTWLFFIEYNKILLLYFSYLI
ncbi:MAG: YdcF family protein [Alphaproteobacteria bacterium]|nr:YdcF family protein [Alphaproteobacteria bacterium]OJV47615.1 MAG: hypothetical protein BGO28_07235 [Alphaproteobacteria bacterium 43-37]